MLSFGWLERKKKTCPFLLVRNRPSGRPTTTHKPRLRNRLPDPVERTVNGQLSRTGVAVEKVNGVRYRSCLRLERRLQLPGFFFDPARQVLFVSVQLFRNRR